MQLQTFASMRLLVENLPNRVGIGPGAARAKSAVVVVVASWAF